MTLQKYIDRVATCIQDFKDNRQGRNKRYTIPSRKQFFQNFVSLTLFHLFDSWEHFIDFVNDGLEES